MLGHVKIMQSSFVVSDGINGSTQYYGITLSTSNSVCLVDSINALSCERMICKHQVRIPSLDCPQSTGISIRVVAANLFGIGQANEPVIGQFYHNCCIQYRL